MFNEILEALRAYASGEASKSGFSRLELLLARITQETQFDLDEFEEILTELVSLNDVQQEDFALGVALIAEKTGCRGALFCDELERKLFASDDPLSARSQFELALLYIRCGGQFAPQQLKQLTTLRSEIPELWLDLAFEAYPRDDAGLLSAMSDLATNDDNPLHWSSLKSRYLKLQKAVANKKFNGFVLSFAKVLDTDQRQAFLEWIDAKRGSQLSLPQPVIPIRSAGHHLIQDTDIDFITNTPVLAEAVDALPEPVAA
uniref:hypothetical protein n=1 Tax=Pararhizobium sp. IMCC3301 TaxID=3067904 RepID=UPI002741DCC0|nr:hypothetical protein [Pararhizobium sp. IMCC3301]